MKAIYVPLPSEAFEALRHLAARELRHPRQQAVRLILDGLAQSATADRTAAQGPEGARAEADDVRR